MFVRLFLLLILVLFSSNSFARDIVSFLENFQKGNYQESALFKKQDSFSTLEKEIYYFFQVKTLFFQKDFSKAASLTKNLSSTSSTLVQKSLAQYISHNLHQYSIAELVLLIELFPVFLNDIDLLMLLKDKLPTEHNKKIYKKLWLVGELKSTEIQEKNNFLNSNEEYLEHLFHLYENREYTYLLKQYPKIKKRFQKDTENYNQYLYQYALVLRKKRKYKQALQVLTPATPIQKVLLLQLKLYLILEQEKLAHHFIEKAKKSASQKTINILRLELARNHYLNQKYHDALFRFQKIDWKYLSVQQKEQAIWQQFYSSVHQADFQKFYQKIKDKNFQYQNYQAGICYWYGKLQGTQKSTYSSCFTNHFLSYYGWQAAHNQEINFQALVPEYNKQPNFLQDKNVLLVQKVYQLQEYGLGDFLTNQYISLPKKLENFQKSAYLFSSNQRYKKLIALGNRYYTFQQLKHSPFLKEWLKALFPLGYVAQITVLAKKYNLEPALIFALIREESHFDPQAISSAGAIGLMQLMPFTAKDVAKRKKISLQDKDLDNISLNLELGIAYLAWELNRFQKEKIYALAAYNGGGGNVRKWQKQQQKDLDYWVEAIPFLETKNYIKKVIRSYHIYNNLYQEQWVKNKKEED